MNVKASRFAILFAVVFISAAAALINCSTKARADETEDILRQKKIVDRYVSLLRRNPRYGTAFDKVYEFHANRASVEEFAASLQKTANTESADRMILGMLAATRGRHKEAVAAFRHADAVRSEDPVASWYLGQSLSSIGEHEAAADALERAIDRNPTRADLLEIYQQLGRLYQRLQQPEKEMKLWQRFEAAFPGDEGVQSQVADMLLQSDQLDGALERFEKLATSATDPYQRMQFAIKAADIKLKSGKRADGLQQLEDLSDQIKPSSWLFGDIRRRIEDEYLKTNDYSGLVDYFRKRLTTHPDDLDAMTRLANYLSRIDRADEAEEWLRRAVEKAPSETRLRKKLISHLVRQRKFEAAVQHYEHLADRDQLRAEDIEEWGRLYLQRNDLPPKERSSNAAAVWMRLLDSDEKDAARVARTADLFREAKIEDEAIRLFEKAIALAPSDVRYREQLGEYFHKLQRPGDATATWQEMAAGDRRSTENLVILSETLQKFGYRLDALAAMQDACGLAPKLKDRIRLAELLRENGQVDESLEQLSLATAQSDSLEDRERIRQERIQCFVAGNLLPAKIEELARRLQDSPGTPDEWTTLALYQEANADLSAAAVSAQNAVKQLPNSVPVQKAAARILEKAGWLAEAANAYEKLTELDPRFQTLHLKQVADLQRRLGRTDAAMEAGRQLLAAAPDNPEHYRFFADLCFQLGQLDDGLEALQRSMRVNPNDTATLQATAEALADRFRTDEAIAFYWRAFEAANTVEQKTFLTRSLTGLYLRSNDFARLVDRLHSQMKDEDTTADALLCLAEAYRTAGDPGMTRQTLERVLADRPDDPKLLTELSRLAERESDFVSATDYRRRLHDAAPSGKTAARLADLLQKAGQIDQAEALWLRFSDTSTERQDVLRTVDRCVLDGSTSQARRLARLLLDRQENDWEAMLRLAIVEWKDGNVEASIELCDRLLDLQLPVLTPSQSTEHNTGSLVPAPTSPWAVTADQLHSFSAGFGNLGVWIDPERRGYRRDANTNASWSAETYGQARATALFLKVVHASRTGTVNSLFRQMAQLSTGSATFDNSDARDVPIQSTKGHQAAWDMYHSHLVFNHVSVDDRVVATDLTLDALLDVHSPTADYAFIRAVQNSSLQNSRRFRFGLAAVDQAPQLSEDRLQQLTAAYKRVNLQHPDWPTNLSFVVQQLNAGGKSEQALELYSHLQRDDATAEELSSAIDLAQQLDDFDAVLKLTSRLVNLQEQSATPDKAAPLRMLGKTYSILASRMVARGNWDVVDRMVTDFLQIKTQAAVATADPRRNQQVSSSFYDAGHFSIYQDGQVIRTQRATLLASAGYWSRSDLGFFVHLLSFYKDDRADHLFQLLETFRGSQSGEEAAVAELALAHLYVVAQRTDDAAIHLVRAAELLPEHAGLRISLVRYYQSTSRDGPNNGNAVEALALLDTITSTAPDVVREKELLALELATAQGNADRARQAAERLFGLRLSTTVATSLAATMKKLGMEEMAEALLSRTNRTVGNNIQSMALLMRSNNGAGHTRAASEMAHQILLQTEGMTQGTRQGESLDGIRMSALKILADSGRLPPLIDRAEQQLKRSPKSVPLHTRLYDYYVASDRNEDANAIKVRLKELQPQNIDSLLQLAEQHERRNERAAACDVYLTVFEKDPQRYTQNYYRYLRVFSDANRLPDLADFLLSRDLKKLQNNYFVVSETIQIMFARATDRFARNADIRAKALELFEAAWTAFPNNRAFLISQVEDESIWESPLAFEYGKLGLIPQSPQQAVSRPWQGVVGKIRFEADGRIVGTLTRLCSALQKQGQLEPFAKLVAEATGKYPSWYGGRILLAGLYLRMNDADKAESALTEIAANPEIKFIPADVAVAAVSELFPNEERLWPALTSLLETAVRHPSARETGSYEVSATRWLVELYASQKRGADVRREVERFLQAKLHGDSVVIDSTGAKDQRRQEQLSVALHLQELGEPLAALRILRELRTGIPPTTRTRRTSNDITRETVQQAELRCRNRITAESLIDHLNDSVIQTDSESPSVRLDLMLTLPDRKQEPQFRSELIELFISKAGQSAATQREVESALHELVSNNGPNRVAASVAAAVFAWHTKDAEQQSLAFASLTRELEAAPPSNSDVDPHPQVAFWLAAKVAAESQQHRELANRLADRAEHAATLSADKRWLSLMLEDRAETAIARGDKQLAEESWSRLLDVVLADTSSKRQTAGTTEPKTSALQELRERLLQKSDQ